MNLIGIIKKEYINITAAVLCAYTLSVLVNQSVFLLFLNKPQQSKLIATEDKLTKPQKTQISVDAILQKPFFELSESASGETAVDEPAAAPVTDLVLLGTITGSPRFAMALIKEKKGKGLDVFKIGSDVFGYRLKSIKSTSVVLVSGNNEQILDMYPEKEIKSDSKTPADSSQSGGGSTISKSLSKAEITQDTQNNLDNMLKGIRAGPYRENNQVVGYKLKTVSSSNILYKYGMRSGDVIRRINGHPIDSTAKLVELWTQFPKESRVVIDIQRNGSITTFDYTITD